MGCDIHIVAQSFIAGAWVDTETPPPFYWRQYGMFGFLAGVRNYSGVTPLSEPRGLPEDMTNKSNEHYGAWDHPNYDYDYRFGDHSFSWLSIEELNAFDYDAIMEDLRVTRELPNGIISGGCTAEPGGGEVTTYREFLGEAFFRDLDRITKAGAGRIVFGFDS